MSTLFTLNHSWHRAPWLYEKLAYAGKDDAILLLEGGVLGLQSPLTLVSFLAKCEAQETSVFALEPDLRLRGINNLYESVVLIDYAEFVDLVTRYAKQVAW